LVPGSKSFPPRTRPSSRKFALQSCRRLTSRHGDRRLFQNLGHETVGSIALALEVGAVTGRSGLDRTILRFELPKLDLQSSDLRLQGFDVRLVTTR
jgi:hypothetical protein